MEILIKISALVKSLIAMIQPYAGEVAGAIIGFFYVYRDKVHGLSLMQKFVYIFSSIVIGVVLGGVFVDMLSVTSDNTVLALGGGCSLFGLALLTKGRELIDNIDKNWLSDLLKNIRDKFTK